MNFQYHPLTSEEQEVVDILGEAWNRFCALRPAHPVDAHEFNHGIHALQNIVMARPVTERLFEERPHFKRGRV